MTVKRTYTCSVNNMSTTVDVVFFYRNSKEVAMLQLLKPLKPNLYINFHVFINNITHNLDSVLKYDLEKLNQKMQLHKSFKI